MPEWFAPERRREHRQERIEEARERAEELAEGQVGVDAATLAEVLEERL